jgi:hypothetical protein
MATQQLTGAELLAWRAKRTGRKNLEVFTEDPTNSPNGPIAALSPLEGYHGVDPDNKDGTPAPDTPAAGSASDNDLRNQLDSALGRVAPLQRQMEELRAAHEAANRRAAELEAALRERDAAQAEAAAARAADEFDPLEGISQEERDLLDSTALAIIAQTAKNAFKKAAGNREDPKELIARELAKRDAQTRDRYIRGTVETLGLIKLGNDTKFNKFLAEDDSAALLMNQFVNAPDTDTARSLEPRIKTMLKRFEKTTDSPRQPDAQDRMSAHLNRDAGAQSTSSHGNLTPEEARRITNEAKRLIRAGRQAEAKKLLAQLY